VHDTKQSAFSHKVLIAMFIIISVFLVIIMHSKYFSIITIKIDCFKLFVIYGFTKKKIQHGLRTLSAKIEY